MKWHTQYQERVGNESFIVLSTQVISAIAVPMHNFDFSILHQLLSTMHAKVFLAALLGSLPFAKADFQVYVRLAYIAMLFAVLPRY